MTEVSADDDDIGGGGGLCTRVDSGAARGLGGTRRCCRRGRPPLRRGRSRPARRPVGHMPVVSRDSFSWSFDATPLQSTR